MRSRSLMKNTGIRNTIDHGTIKLSNFKNRNKNLYETD